MIDTRIGAVDILATDVISSGMDATRTELEATYPVIANGIPYWFFFHIVAQDTSNPDAVGLTRAYMYSAESYAELYHAEEPVYLNQLTPGIRICDNRTPGREYRCIVRGAYEYTAVEREMTIEQVCTFLTDGMTLDAFCTEFGEPNAYKCTKSVLASTYDYEYYYECGEIDGTPLYIKLLVEDGTLTHIYIVDLEDQLLPLLNDGSTTLYVALLK